MRLTKLDGLRGIFSLMVLIYHYPKDFLPDYFYNFFIFRQSYVFVDFFFVLSGFVIAYNYNSLNSYKGLWIYLKKRFIRLYPLLLFTVSIYFLFRVLTMYLFPDLLDSDNSLDSMLMKTVDSLLFTNSTPILGSSSGMNTPSWSISSEMISYIVFGLITIFCNAKTRRIIFFITIILASTFLLKHGTLFKIGDYGFLRGMVSFLLGYFVWELSLIKKKTIGYVEYIVPIILVMAFYGLSESRNSSLSIFFDVTIPLTFAFLILVFLWSNGPLSKMLNSKKTQFLGKISYSLYLNHYLLVLVVPRLSFRFLNMPNNDYAYLFVFLLTIIVCIVYSYFTYIFIEQKGSKLLKRFFL
ncbi:acyltransferase family protein [Maribacter sp. 2210JD10-5]|uniref:acyltransferase family protein n=1 Tax=Maribacter sp. 2210JD10-5 TaxID=3386272 RepID=UPI0039BD688E